MNPIANALTFLSVFRPEEDALWLHIGQCEREGWDKLGCQDSEDAMLLTLFQQSSKPCLFSS